MLYGYVSSPLAFPQKKIRDGRHAIADPGSVVDYGATRRKNTFDFSCGIIRKPRNAGT